MPEIKVQKKKDSPYYRVFNDVDGEVEAYSGPLLTRMNVPIENKMNPFVFKYDGDEFILDRGQSMTLKEGVVKNLIGDWDIKDDDKYVKEMKRVIDALGFIPKLRLQKLITPKEAAEKDERLKNRKKYVRPTIEVQKAKPMPREPVAADEEEPEGFSSEAIEEGEKKKGPGRPKKES